jgi:hypothetical protein
MQNFYASDYENAIQFAWSTNNSFEHSSMREHIGETECLKVYCMGIHYMTIFWDISLYEDAPRFQQVN